MVGVAEHGDRVAVLARRDVAQREGLPHHPASFFATATTPGTNRLRRPRLQSAVATEAVETCFSLARVASGRT
jgi:hypothetical protein